MKIGKHIITNNGQRVFVIAEAGSNHDGSLVKAYKLIDAAVAAKADAVKFQIFKANKLYPPTAGIIQLDGKPLDIYKFLKDSEVTYSWIARLKSYCDQKKIIFIATPFDEKSADILERSRVLAYKVASPELNHIPLIRYIAKNKKPMIMSDGLSTLTDIQSAIDTVHDQGNKDIAILHCVSSYPAPADEYNLNFLTTLKNVFGIIPGLSDHTTHPTTLPVLAVCAGAKVIEKHFTLSKKDKGADHFYALEPQELKLMIQSIRRAEKYTEAHKLQLIAKYPKIMGSFAKFIVPSEQEIYPGDKRSLFSIKAIKKGEKITRKNCAVLRAERFLKPGIHPKFLDIILGKKAQRSIAQYRGIQWNDLLQ